MGDNNSELETKHSRMYDKYKARYDRGGCTTGQLSRLVSLGVITAEEYQEITGGAYDV